VDWEGTEIQLEWAVDKPEIPLYVAGYGPRALGVAGRVADGVIIQLADPAIIEWTMATARRAAEEAGRDPSALRCLVCAPSKVSDDIAQAREEVRWFPAMVGNHVADLVDRYGREGQTVPKRLTDYIEGRKGYDYRHHADINADHLGFISDDIIESFGVLGAVEQHVAKLKELASIGVTQFNIYLMCGEEERQIAEYAEHVLPHFKSEKVTA
jgi:alkanesulfonate monooxygenase SsuD/methylene tetrahydromethanopterin reductase-like flavin-dependent oxidoreductase (luciferase family)